MRIATGLAFAALMLSACGGEPPAAPVEPVAETPAPAPEATGPNTLTAEQTAELTAGLAEEAGPLVAAAVRKRREA